MSHSELATNGSGQPHDSVNDDAAELTSGCTILQFTGIKPGCVTERTVRMEDAKISSTKLLTNA